MARTRTTKKTPVRKSTSKAVAKWDEQMAREAEAAAKMEESAGGGQFFSTRGGILTWQDAPLPDNQMAVVILDSIFENCHYPGEYDPETPQSPDCYAFGRDESELAPHELVVQAGTAISDQCHGCEMNEFGSAERGRGKACRNSRRLAMVPAGEISGNAFDAYEDPEHYLDTSVGYMKLPVTSIKGYANFVRQAAAALQRPPHGLFTKVRVVPDPKTQFKVLFEPIDTIPNELMGAIMERREQIMGTIDFPYQPMEDEEPAAKPARGRRTTKKKAAKRKARRY